MCIAMYSPAGNSIPSDETLKICFQHNRDGAGFAFNHNGKVKICKGFMTIESLLDALHECDKTYNLTSRGVLLHCRIGTAGSKSRINTHPFPLTDHIDDLHATEFDASYAMVHNGIIQLTNNDPMIRDKDISDTAVFVIKYLYPLSTNQNWMSEPKNMEMISKMVGSYNKIAILNGKGEIVSTSGFTKAEDGNYYSNTTYKNYTSTTNYHGSRYYDYYENELWDDEWDDWEISRIGFYPSETPRLNSGKKNSTASSQTGFIDNDSEFYKTKDYVSVNDTIFVPLMHLLPSWRYQFYQGGELYTVHKAMNNVPTFIDSHGTLYTAALTELPKGITPTIPDCKMYKVTGKVRVYNTASIVVPFAVTHYVKKSVLDAAE